MKLSILLIVVSALAAITEVSAEAPVMQASGPIIHLADNLDEKDKLGWCWDTEGPGLSEVLHTRACSADDDSVERDFSFTFDNESGQIKSVSFPGKCASINAEDSEHAFGLFDCDSENNAQQFSYDDEQLSFHPADNKDLCVVVAPMAMDHGRFRSRAIKLATCDETDLTLRQWMVKE